MQKQLLQEKKLWYINYLMSYRKKQLLAHEKICRPTKNGE